jgi:hypothetical protein
VDKDDNEVVGCETGQRKPHGGCPAAAR